MSAEAMHSSPAIDASSTDEERVQGSVVDLFCGAGGLTHGFLLEGFKVSAGIDVDEDCRFPFEANNDAPFLRRDVEKLTNEDLSTLFHPGEPRVLVGCRVLHRLGFQYLHHCLGLLGTPHILFAN
jgi:DNA (cytosine-5)-methyltransferase 1